MARPVSWLARLDPIARSVANSVRSHYDRQDLEALFDLKRRAIFDLLACLPTTAVGRSVLVERAALETFLARLRAADDPAAELTRLRSEKPATPRRALRAFRRTEVAASLDELPSTITLSPGELHVRFQTMEELGFALTALAEVLQEDLDAFALRYEPPQEPTPEELEQQQIEREEAEWFRNWGKQEKAKENATVGPPTAADRDT